MKHKPSILCYFLGGSAHGTTSMIYPSQQAVFIPLADPTRDAMSRHSQPVHEPIGPPKERYNVSFINCHIPSKPTAKRVAIATIEGITSPIEYALDKICNREHIPYTPPPKKEQPQTVWKKLK